MRVGDSHYRTIWHEGAHAGANPAVNIIDQTLLPHRFVTRALGSVAEVVTAIATMQVRGAPLIGVAGAYGLWLAACEDASDAALGRAYDALLATRPTAVNLRWALDKMLTALRPAAPARRAPMALQQAAALADADVAVCRAIGDQGARLLAERWQAKRGQVKRGQGGARLNILTHCNAGWLATVDWGTALAPVYRAHADGVPVHVWVDETRPRNQGASLTAWELAEQGIEHTVVVDNAGGHLMQHGMVDLCLVGTDRTTATGDVCNKIGTYLKALAAADNKVPFYACVPSSSIDWRIADGVREIPIEQRQADEVHCIAGRTATGEVVSVRLTPSASAAANYAFDVTPARLVTGLITERGVCGASRAGLSALFPNDGS